MRVIIDSARDTHFVEEAPTHLVEGPHGILHDLGHDVDAHTIECIEQLLTVKGAVGVAVDEGEGLHQTIVADGATTVLELQLDQCQLEG